jgi:hypothetical protein
MKSKFIYLVSYSLGEAWAELQIVDVFTTQDEPTAKAYVDKFNAKLSKWKRHFQPLHVAEEAWQTDNPRYCQIMETNKAFYTKIEVR